MKRVRKTWKTPQGFLVRSNGSVDLTGVPPGPDQLRLFLETLLQGAPSGEWLTTMSMPTPPSGTRPRITTDGFLLGEEALIEDVVEYVGSLDARRRNAYVAVATQTQEPDGYRRGTMATAGSLSGSFLDIDLKHADEFHEADPDDLLVRCAEAVRDLPFGPPTMTLCSGNGLQVWFNFRQWLPLTDDSRESAAALLADFREASWLLLREKGFPPDSPKDLARVLRLPGSRNWKSDPPKLVRLIDCRPGQVFDPEELRSQIDEVLPPRVQRRRGASRQSSVRRERTSTLPPGEVLEPIEPLPVDTKTLNQRLKDVLRQPVGADRSRQVYGAVANFIEAGYADGQVKALLQDHHAPTIDRDDEEDLDRCIRQIRSLHPHVGKSCRSANCSGIDWSTAKPELMADIEAFWAAVDDATRNRGGSGGSGARGPTRGSIVAVAEGMAQVAKKAGGLAFDASVREIAERAGVTKNTVMSVIPWLESENLITVARDRPLPIDANRYRLVVPLSNGPRDSQVVVVGGCGPNMTVVDDPRHDTWAHRGLGKNGLAVFRALLQAPGPLTVDEIAANTEMPSTTVRRKLRAMERVHAVRRNPKSQWELTEDYVVRLKRAPVYLGTLDTNIKRMWGHDRDRREWYDRNGFPAPNTRRRPTRPTRGERVPTVTPSRRRRKATGKP